ncbi:MAG: hypothetical protein ABI579_04285 [Candidatus Sumerlaeota bacterium]
MRFLAAAFLSVVNACWFVGFAWAVSNGTKLTALFSFTAILGLIWISLRTREASELSFAVVDRLYKFEMAPSSGDILFRFIVGCAAPALCLVVAFLAREREVVMLAALLLFAFSEAVFRLSGARQWRSSRIHFPVMRTLLTGTPNAAVQALEADNPLRGPSLEMTVLAISSAALRENSAGMIPRLVDYLDSLSISGEQDRKIVERLRAVLRADEATMDRRDDELQLQAQALMALPPLHPRRSSFALLVATEAMEAGDHTSAIKALRMLHSCEVLGSPPRLLIDWFLAESARKIGDEQLSTRAQAAIRTFDIARVLRELNIDKVRSREDAMARMICAAHDALKASLPSQERPARPVT